MLAELRVENYAVIDAVAVEFGPGLNLLTGETGAGKSMLVDALGLLLGDKASADVVRHGAEKAVVAAVFQPECERAAKILEANGIACEAEEPIIVRREIAGKGRVFINNQPATVSLLRLIAPELAVVHAQNESLVKFDAAARLELLDQFAGVDQLPNCRTAELPNCKTENRATAQSNDVLADDRRRTTDDVPAAFAAWNALKLKIAELERDEQDRLRLVDLWSFQNKEIAQANLEPDEDERLEAEKRVLANAERVYGSAMEAFDLLYDGERSALASLRAAERPLENLSRFDEKFRESLSALEGARLTVEDLGTTLRDYAESIHASPERLAEIEDRLALLDRLKRKYGATLADVIAFGDEAARKLNEIVNRDEVLRQLRRELDAAAERYLTAARALSRRRYAAAKELERLVEAEVNDLAMKATFRVHVSGTDEPHHWTSSGFDQVAFLIATNPGEPLKPLEEIASGGEMSRVMLALKLCVQRSSVAGRRSPANSTTLVFDEIDTGIGGRAAEAVGKKLKALARRRQVLCVTHLPQIASFADQHFCIEKREHGGRTRTAVRLLDGGERRQEIARMLSGAKVTDASLKNAEQMLKANA